MIDVLKAYGTNGAPTVVGACHCAPATVGAPISVDRALYQFLDPEHS